MRGMGNMQQMMKKMQKMQKDMLAAQEGLKDQTVEGTVSGGMVTAIANGDGKILDIKIKEEVVDPEDIEMLQDMVLTAVNDALEKSTQLKEETLGKFTNGLNIPDYKMQYPKPILDLIDSYSLLPGIGRKTAIRLAFHTLR